MEEVETLRVESDIGKFAPDDISRRVSVPRASAQVSFGRSTSSGKSVALIVLPLTWAEVAQEPYTSSVLCYSDVMVCSLYSELQPCVR